MTTIIVKGIDRDEESRSITFTDVTAEKVASQLHREGWKWAGLWSSEGRQVGGVSLSVRFLRRTYWYESE